MVLYGTDADKYANIRIRKYLNKKTFHILMGLKGFR